MRTRVLYAATALLCALAFFPTALSAQESFSESEPSIGKSAEYTHAVTGMFVSNTGQGFEPYHLALQAAYTFESPNVSVLGGIKAAKGDLQFTAQGIWWPLGIRTEWMSLRFGAGLTYNFTAYIPYSVTNNILPGAYIQFAPGSHYTLTADISYFFKARTVFAVAGNSPFLPNSTMAFRVRNDFYITNGFGAYLEVSSYELFRYMILCAPSVTIGGTYDANDHLRFALEATARFTDFFTVSAYYDSTEVRFLVRYVF